MMVATKYAADLQFAADMVESCPVHALRSSEGGTAGVCHRHAGLATSRHGLDRKGNTIASVSYVIHHGD